MPALDVARLYEVLIATNIPAGSLQWAYAPEAGPPPPEVRAEAAAHAARLRAEAERSGRPLRLEDRPVARVLSYRQDGEGLSLTLGHTTYFHAVATGALLGKWLTRWGPHALANALAVSAVSRTADGQLVLEQRSDAVAEYPGSYHVKPSGQVHPPSGPLEATLGELKEELDVPSAEVMEMRCVGLLRNPRNAKYEAVFSLALRPAWEAVCDRQPAEGWEAARLVTVPDDAEALARWLVTQRDAMVPAGHGALLLYGRARFGELWYQVLLAQLGVRPVG